MKISQKGFTVLKVILIVVIVGIIGGVAGYVISQQQKDDKSTQQVESPSSTQKTADTKENTDLVNYITTELPSGVIIEKKADVDRLKGASDSFKAFMASKVKDVPTDNEGCGNVTQIQVAKIYRDTFASGGEGGCGGAGQIWKKENGTWKSVLGYQQEPNCKEVTAANIPKVILERCYDEASNQVIANPN